MSQEITISKSYSDNTPYDLDSLFNYAVEAPFALPTKATVYACVMGENDESSWYWMFEVDGQIYFATGGCDYTGWDCRSWGEVKAVKNIEAALALAPEDEDQFSLRPIRKWLTAQIDGNEQIGVVTL